mmetsp:Transcript_2434/g.7279  ORF Transcript_2434/g.7279 Transcript_2434/m.7279 type:complete len:145 (+) Transcript_2434:131-565(+)
MSRLLGFGLALARNGAIKWRHGGAAMARRQTQPNVSGLRMIRGFPNEFNNSPNAEGSERLIGELVDFPCVFVFKIVGTNEGEFVGDILDTVSACVNIDSKKLKFSTRDKGKYRSITLEVPCNTADQVYNIYAAIDRDPRVKFKF